MKQLFSIFSVSMFCIFPLLAEKEIWKGDVKADGTPSKNVELTLEKNYKIKVTGEVNLGKWWQKGKPLANDACYEYNEEVTPVKLETFKNSLNITVCENNYQKNHIYESKPFVAKQTEIHFWIYDTDYNDNTGALQVSVIELD